MRLLEGLVHLLSPPRCAACDLAMAPGERLFCGGCELLVEAVPERQRAPHPSSAAFVFGGPLADAVRRFKYAGRSDLGAPLGQLLAGAALPFAGRVDRVVPVPLHVERLRERGFNQSALLAKPAARALGVSLDVRSLARVRPTRVQAGLQREERHANVEGAFRATGRARSSRVLLVDDVRTTGATLASAALALKEGGAGAVYTLALARAQP